METTKTAIVQLDALPAWLALSRSQRRHIVSDDVEPALATYPGCRARWIDVEAFSGTCSDVLVVDFVDWLDWNHLWERLRDSRLFATPYFRVESLLVGIEDGYRQYEASVSSPA